MKQDRPKRWWSMGSQMYPLTIKASIAEVSAYWKECHELLLWTCGRKKVVTRHDFEGRMPKEKYSLESRSKVQSRNHSFIHLFINKAPINRGMILVLGI